MLRRRKSLGDSVLERNLCFVDTPGYGNKTSVGPESSIYSSSKPILTRIVPRGNRSGRGLYRVPFQESSISAGYE